MPKSNYDDPDFNLPNAQQLEAELFKGLTSIANKYGRECTKVISQPRSWAGFSDTRDIVDTGQLRASQKIDYFPSELAIEVSYNTEYAAAVHNGATIQYPNGNTRTIPPRPWMQIAADSLDLEGEIEDKFYEIVSDLF